jgi:hypothetical protein
VSYTIVRTNGSVLTTIPDGTVNTTSTPLSLPGRNFASYGQIVDTNFVRALENFADSTPPNNAIRGQLWYNTTANVLYICPTDGEANVALWVPILTPNNISNIAVDNLVASANITANNASITNNANANAISTNYLTVNVQANIANANITGNAVISNLQTVNVTTGSTSIAGTLTGAWTIDGATTINTVPGTSLYVTTGNVVIDAGIKTDNYLYANGDPVSFDGTYTNSNVAAFLPTYTGNVGAEGSSAVFNGRTLSTGSNTTTGNIIGNWTLSAGSQINGLSGIAGANVTGTVANAAFATTAGTAGSATTAATVTANAQPNITSVGTLTSLSVSGNANAGNIGATNFVGSGALLTALNASNLLTGTVPSDRLTGSYSISVTSATTAGTVTTAAQPNITSLGTLTGLSVNGAVSFTGSPINLGSNSAVKITGGASGEVLTTDGAGNLSWQSAGAALTAQTVINNAQPNITSVGTLTSLAVSGNVSAGNVAATNISGTTLAGTLTTAAQPNITSVGTLTGLGVSGNAAFTGQVVNLGAVGNLRITGGLAGQVLRSAGAGVVIWDSGDSATTAITVTGNAQPNITSVGTLSSLSVSGNTVSGNVSVSGRFVGNAIGLTNIPGANVTGQVANSLSAGTVYSNSQPNITSVGTLTSLNVSGNITASNVSVSGRFVGNASGLNSIPGANVTGVVPSASFATSAGSATTATSAGTANTANTATNATFATSAGTATSATSASVAGSVTTAAQPNITSVGTLTSLAVSGSLTRGGQNVVTLGDFTSTSTGSPTGWARLPNGLLLQFGTATVFRQTFTSISYPIAFSAFSVAVVSGSTQSSADGSQGGPGVTDTSTTGFTTFVSTDSSGPAITVRYIAIGF